jgi:hypothetical protein
MDNAANVRNMSVIAHGKFTLHHSTILFDGDGQDLEAL